MLHVYHLDRGDFLERGRRFGDGGHEEIPFILLLGVLLSQYSASLWDHKSCIRTLENSEGSAVESLVVPSHSVVPQTEHKVGPYTGLVAVTSLSRGSAPCVLAFAATEQF